MADYVERYSGKASDKLEKQIRRVYKQAAEEVQKKLDDFIRGHKARNAQMLQMVADGKLSKQDYQKWMRGQVFQGDQWKQKLKDVTDVYVHADEKAREIVGGTSKNVFMEAANYTAYDLEKGMRGAVAFNVYDAKTVERLLKKDPKMLPEWKIDQPKDYKWNEKRVRNAVAQGIIQGESVEEVGDRLTGELATSNAAKMDMFARTAINGAQNAGRMDRLHEAEEMGIEVRKKWLATLDQRTRDTHQALDGQEQPIDEPFVVDGMKIDYPGDPFAPPELVYNCFVGETSAYTNCEIERSYCHEYKGELIEIETSCGVKFTCTPNHPILTLDGWVSAASLHNGDDLLVTKVGNRLGFGRNCNVKHVLSCMKTFHDSFKGSGLVSRNSTLSVNFHGDIPTSEVEIITKKRFLPDNRNPGISERIKKFLFELPYKAFACKCSFMKHLWRIGFSTFSFICGKCKSFPLFWGRFGHSQKHGLRPIALFNPGGVQPLNDNVAGNIQIISDCLDGFTGIVLADNIISVNKCSGCTHVYNLQTENGYYFVNTIITKSAGKRNGFAAISHNCRCTLTYVYPKYQHLQHNHERRDQLNDKNIENMTYYEWVGLKKKGDGKSQPSEKKYSFQNDKSFAADLGKHELYPYPYDYADYDKFLEQARAFDGERNNYIEDVRPGTSVSFRNGPRAYDGEKYCGGQHIDYTIARLEEKVPITDNSTHLIVCDYEDAWVHLPRGRDDRRFKGDSPPLAQVFHDSNQIVIAFDRSYMNGSLEDSLAKRQELILNGEILPNVFPIESPETVVMHEWGHVINDYYTHALVYQDETAKNMFAWWQTLTKDEIRSGISDYASENFGEFCAECFAEMQTDNPRPLAKKYWDFMSDLIKKRYTYDK